MPIRIRKDSNASDAQKFISRTNSGIGGSGGGGIGGVLISLLFGLFKRSPKLAIALVAVAIGGYFLLSRMNSNVSSAIQNAVFGTGLEMDQKVYDEAEVFEPLADNVKNPLPESVSLLKYCPDRLNQGSQGSCVGWASAYAARTILHAKASGENPNDVTFSPSYVYNQIALSDCQGAYMQKAMDLMRNGGALPFSMFGYNENSCATRPSSREKEAAESFKIKGFNRLTKGGDNYQTDLLAIKQNLAQGAPVVIGMMVGGSFMTDMSGKKAWIPNNSDYNLAGFGGHAMCVIGYDDYYNGGSFQIMNSWGESWGNDGIFWIRYNDFDFFTREAYGLYPMGDSDISASSTLSAEIALVANSTGQYIPLTHTNGSLFTTTSTVSKNTYFKIEITNSMECYIYLFGKETDESSYVLFPYTAKHSPYCGITGTRLFPKDHSLYPDELGNIDQIAIVVSVQKLDFKKLNDAINQAQGGNFDQKVYNTLKNELVKNIDFKSGNSIKFSANLGNKGTVLIILEIQK